MSPASHELRDMETNEMPRRLLDRLTFSNVVAMLALFIALGGTSYAALKLPRNSVGATQIRAGAVGSSEIRDRSIALKDVSRAARSSLRGATGLQGPAGAQGPAGTPAVRHFAAVSAAGIFLRGDATHGGREGVGSYTVGFAYSISACAWTATLGTTDGTTVAPGRVTVNEQSGVVGVQTYDAAGVAADLPFHVIVAC
jgi:hypothetical protein